MSEIDLADVQPLPKNLWFKRNCTTCDRHDEPFEQRNWSSCLACTIDVRLFQIEGAFNPRNHNRTARGTQKLLDNLVELLQIYRFAEIWREILSMEHYELVTVNYDGKPEPRNFSGLTLTNKGKSALKSAHNSEEDKG